MTLRTTNQIKINCEYAYDIWYLVSIWIHYNMYRRSRLYKTKIQMMWQEREGGRTLIDGQQAVKENVSRHLPVWQSLRWDLAKSQRKTSCHSSGDATFCIAYNYLPRKEKEPDGGDCVRICTHSAGPALSCCGAFSASTVCSRIVTAGPHPAKYDVQNIPQHKEHRAND